MTRFNTAQLNTAQPDAHFSRSRFDEPASDPEGDFARESGIDNVLKFPAPERDSGAAALELIYQAADLFAGIEDRARDTEARARALCASAIERLRLAEQRVEAADSARREVIQDTGRKLQDVSRTLKLAQQRIDAAEARAQAAESRALAAEAAAQDARRALARVEAAIRSRLLGEAVEEAPMPRRATA